MSSQVTQGKWKSENPKPTNRPGLNPDGKRHWNKWVHSIGEGIAHVFGRTQAECEANAHLIAASPDLLAALESLTEWARDNTSPQDTNSPHALLIASVAAIAKAKGE